MLLLTKSKSDFCLHLDGYNWISFKLSMVVYILSVQFDTHLNDLNTWSRSEDMRKKTK